LAIKGDNNGTLPKMICKLPYVHFKHGLANKKTANV